MKKNRKWAVFALAGTLAVCLAVVLVINRSTAEAASKNGTEIIVGKGEERVDGTLTSVIGNEIVCLVTETQEEKEYQIPVGTEVTTKLGTVTTFSKLAAGSRVAVIVQEGTDIVDAVWIVE